MDSRRVMLLAQLDDLDARDRSLAELLAELASLTDEVQTLRQAAVDTVAGRDRLPEARARAEAERAVAGASLSGAVRAQARAEATLADLERGRKEREDDLDRARRELRQATEELQDATARVGRADMGLIELDELEAVLVARSNALVVGANGLRQRLESAPRVAAAGKGEPGADVRGLDEWGARARAALFVAHSTLATERERVLLEANGLAASVLGETGAVSVALVRERLAEIG